MGQRIGSGRALGKRLGHCYDPEPHIIPNLTRQVENRMLKKIIDGNMQFVTAAVNGLQGAGKTEYIMYWLWRIEQEYPPQLTWTIYADSVDVILEEIKKVPPHIRVVKIVLEDMMSHQDSYSTAADKKKAADWFLIRHKIKEVIGPTGIIYGFLIWQRYTSVNANFRNTDMYALLSPMLNESDADVIRRMIGQKGYQAVRQEYADRQIMDVRRSRVVVHISALDDPLAGYHDYKYIRQADPEWVYPLLLESAKYFAPAPIKTIDQVLDELAKDDRYAAAVDWYRRAKAGEKQAAIAAEQNRAKSTVSEGIARIDRMVNEKAAA